LDTRELSQRKDNLKRQIEIFEEQVNFCFSMKRHWNLSKGGRTAVIRT
uniref:Uncharacterized protein n=1 Tax=Pygocentrus nattereri TaxID=42514 RepID=A0AAR2IVT2_PYGNA